MHMTTVLYFVLFFVAFLARAAFVKTNRCAIAMMFVRLCLSVYLGRACTVIIRCTLARI